MLEVAAQITTQRKLVTMIETKSVVQPRRVGMDLEPPYAVYLDGEPLAEYATQGGADAHYLRLIDELRVTPPAELTERFLPAEQVLFELVQRAGTVRFWKSTVTRQLDSEPALEAVKYHVTDYDAANNIFMTDFESASAFFELAQLPAGRRAGAA